MHNLSETAVIGSILLEGDLIHETTLRSHHFDKLAHQIIFQSMQKVAKKGVAVDLVSVVAELGDTLNEVGGVDYLSKMAESVPSTNTFKHYEQLVLEAYKHRQTKKLLSEHLNHGDPTDVSNLIKQLTELEESTHRNKRKTKKDILLDVIEHIHERKKDMTGVPSGIVEFDRLTGGLQKQDLIIIAARPSMGKTAFALNLASANCKNGGVSTIFSLEMPDKQLMFRILSSVGNIDGHKWRNPDKLFTADDFHKATKAIGIVEKWDLEIIDESTLTVNQIRAEAKEIKKRYPDREHVFIIDYLQLISGGDRRNENRQQEVSEISRSLKGLARELDSPIVALSQLSRNVEGRQNKRPMLSDLRESGAIEQDADVVAFLYRDDYYDKETEAKNITEIIIGKQRNGPIGTVEAVFVKEFGKFANIERRLE